MNNNIWSGSGKYENYYTIFLFWDLMKYVFNQKWQPKYPRNFSLSIDIFIFIIYGVHTLQVVIYYCIWLIAGKKVIPIANVTEVVILGLPKMVAN